MQLLLNVAAQMLAEQFLANAESSRVEIHRPGGAIVVDCGIETPGGMRAGLLLAHVCLADQAEVALVPSPLGPAIQVSSDDPVRACLASQYAGWQVKVGKFFAMGSGPMRALYGKEAIFDHIPGREVGNAAVGVLETRKLPDEAVVEYLCDKLGIAPSALILLCAPASSLAGSFQVVARSLETALHKLHELKFDLTQVVSGYGVAPLPPVASDEMQAIGRTNDAILYGGEVTIWVTGDDEQIAAIGAKVPSSASADHGAPFAEIFERYNRDFYKIDPHLFSPAVITLNNLATGKRHTFGRLEPTILAKSFG